MAVHTTPRMGMRVGPAYLSTSFRPQQQHRPQSSAQQRTAAQRGYGPAPRMQPTTQQYGQHTRPRLNMVRPNAGGVFLISLGMLIMGMLVLVAMMLLAAGAGIVPMSTPSSHTVPTNSPVVSVSTGRITLAPAPTTKR